MNDLESRIHEKFDNHLAVQQDMINNLKEEMAVNRKKIKNWPELKGNLRKRTLPRFSRWRKVLSKHRAAMSLGPFRREIWKLSFYQSGAPFHWRVLLVRLQIGFLLSLKLLYIVLVGVLSLGLILILLYWFYRTLMGMIT